MHCCSKFVSGDHDTHEASVLSTTGTLKLELQLLQSSTFCIHASTNWSVLHVRVAENIIRPPTHTQMTSTTNFLFTTEITQAVMLIIIGVLNITKHNE